MCCCVSEAWLSQSRYNPISSRLTLSIQAWQTAYGKKLDLLTHILHFWSCCPLVKLTWPDEQLRLKQATFVLLFKELSNNPAPNPRVKSLVPWINWIRERKRKIFYDILHKLSLLREMPVIVISLPFGIRYCMENKQTNRTSWLVMWLLLICCKITHSCLLASLSTLLQPSLRFDYQNRIILIGLIQNLQHAAVAWRKRAEKSC